MSIYIMKIDRLNDIQFNHILEVLIHYKRCNPNIDVYLNESSIKEALNYFVKNGLFESLTENITNDTE